ncbi:MAG: DUF2914 domain-containing protein [Deltaproteobacteria bacterium]|jgi:hypothetical protein|nr:DUF2914 domain-containing protein [Deltaproteobacteria bacterium]
MLKKALLTLISLGAVFGLLSADAADANDNPSSLQVENAVICRVVENRVPLGTGNVFTSDAGKLYCFTKIVGAVNDTVVTHRWFLNGDLKSSVNLPVKSKSWRTWSSKRIDAGDAGDWMVEVVSADGVVLSSIIFLVQQ